MNRVKYWLWLTMVFGVGNDRLWKVMNYFEDPVLAYEQLCSENHNMHLNHKEQENISTVSLEKCEETINIYKEKGIGTAGFSSREYPQYLRNIYNPPAVLFYKGNIDVLNQKLAVTIVGTRKASEHSLMIANRLSRELAMSGFVIASGFAVGIDIKSHMAAVSAGCPTACVMGCGLDVNYPKDNFTFRDSILENGGVFISEFPLGTPPFSGNFPRRNRILSGISRAVIVVEAGEKSGSLITAELALEQGREVFCVPPANIYDSRYAGNIKFLRDGAGAVYGYEDIVSYFGLFDGCIPEINFDGQDEDLIEFPAPNKPVSCNKYEKPKKLPETLNQSEKNSPKQPETMDLSGFSDMQREIIRVLMQQGEAHLDVISDTLGYDVPKVAAELSNLELDDIVEAFPGKIYGLK